MFSKMKLIVVTDDEVEYDNISKILNPLHAFKLYNSNDVKINIGVNGKYFSLNFGK